MNDETIGTVEKDLDGEYVIVTAEYNAYFDMIVSGFEGKMIKIIIEEVEG